MSSETTIPINFIPVTNNRNFFGITKFYSRTNFNTRRKKVEFLNHKVKKRRISDRFIEQIHNNIDKT